MSGGLGAMDVGRFYLALTRLLAPDSRIFAVDIDICSLNQILEQFQQVAIEKRMADFLDEDFPNPWVQHPIGFDHLNKLFENSGSSSPKNSIKSPHVITARISIRL